MTCRILIVEDEPILRKTLGERFTQEGFAALLAKDGEEGLNLALTKKPELILLDIILPKMDGMTLFAKMRETNDWGKQVPVILLTNLTADDQIMRGVEENKPAYYLVKTDFTLDEVVAKVRERLARPTAAAEPENRI